MSMTVACSVLSIVAICTVTFLMYEVINAPLCKETDIDAIIDEIDEEKRKSSEQERVRSRHAEERVGSARQAA